MGNVVGLGCEYTAVRSGKVGIVAAIASTEGAIAAVLSAIAGEPLGRWHAVLALIAAGIVLASLEQSEGDEDTAGREGQWS